MSKLIPVSLGIIGTGGMGIGSYLIFKPSESKNTLTLTLGKKYEKSLLNFEGSTDEKVWNSKFTALKTGSPHHPDLKKIDTSSESLEAKSLHKEACKQIYNSPSDNKYYLEDFKNYCSKLIGDMIDGTWIEDDSQTSNKWDGKLTNLNTNKNNLIHKGLSDLSKKITVGSLNASNRKELRDWCYSKRKQLFYGEESRLTEEIKNYCTEN